MANLSNINNKFLVTTGGNVLIGQTSAVGSSIFQVTGAATITGNATFGGSGTFASTLTVNTANSNILTLNRTTSAGGYMRFQNNGTDKFYIGSRGTVSGSGGTGYDMYAVASNDLKLFTNATLALTLDTSQNATFAGRVVIENTTTLTTGVVDSLLIKTLSSGTPITNGFGGALSFYLENTVYSAINEVGKIAVIETDTTAIHDKMVFSVKDNNTLAERLTLNGSGAIFTGNITAPTLSLTGLTQNTTSSLFLVKDEVVGAELVTNGNFDSSTGWNLNSNWSVSGGTCNANGTSNNDINQSQNVGVVGQIYRITYVISAYTQGSISARIGGAATALNTGTGTFSQVVTAVSTDRIRMNISTISGNSFIGSVDSLSIKQITSSSNSVEERFLASGAFGDELWAVTPTNSDNISNLNSGNVGIGTASPTVKLHSNVSSASGNFLTDGSIYALEVSNSDTTAGNAVGINFGHGGYDFTSFIASVRTGTGANPTGDLVFGGRPSDGAAFVERMRITSAGNVGIGVVPVTSWDTFTALQIQGSSLSGLGQNNTVLGSNVYHNSNAFKYIGTGAATLYQQRLGEHRWFGAASGTAGNTASVTQHMVIDSSGNVGIGTTSPGNKLTIATGTGGGSAPDSRTQLYIDKNGEAYISINSPAESFNGIRLSVAGTPKGFMELYDNTAQGKKFNIGTVDARDVVFATSNQPKMTLQASSGNFGIGVTSPGAKLQIASSTNADGILLTGDGSGSGMGTGQGRSIDFQYTKTDSSFGSALRFAIPNNVVHGGALTFHTDNTVGTLQQAMVINQAQNVGIGVTGPTSKLHVVGSNTGSIPLVDLRASGTGEFQRGVRLLNAGMNVGDHIMYAIGQSDSSKNMGQTYFYYAGSGSTSNRISMGLHGVDDVFNILGTGNVGIGRTNPSAKLHVQSTANADVVFKLENTNTGTSAGARIELICDEAGSGSGGGELSHSIGSYSQTVGNWIIESGSAAGQLDFSTVDAFAMRIDEEQNVGIGTTSPVQKLHVDGNTQLGRNGNNIAGDPQKTIISGQGIEDPSTGNFFGSYGFLELNSNNNYTGGARRYAITNGLLANKFAIIRSDSGMATMQLGVGGALPAGAVADFVIDNTGKVGIGTTAPSAKLTIISSGAEGIQLGPDTSSSGNSGRIFWTNSSGGWAMMAIGQVLSVRSAATPGTTSGAAKVQLTNYSSTAWTASSDESLKENINSIGNVLDKINNYRCVEYNLIDDEDKNKKIGFIAQDWQKDFPQIVEEMEDEKIGMKYTETIPVLLKAIQELEARVKELENK